jgi:predicted NBD/HSP70 family sugar kinase
VTVRLADLRGDRVASSSEPLAHVSVPADDRVAAVCRHIGRVLAMAGVEPSRVLAVTVGVPTSVDADSRPLGREAYLPGLPGRDLGPEIGGQFGWPVLVENDANLAAWGERWRGVAAGVDDLVVLLADERLGSGLFSDGRPVRGHRGGAGELRLLELVERVGSTYGIAWLLRTLGAEAVAGLGPAGPAGGRGRVLWERCGGDPARVGTATVLEVVISGAVAGAGDLLLHRIGDRLVPDLIDLPPRLAMSSLGDQAVVVGAVRMALDHVEASLLGSPGAAPWKEAPALSAAPSQDGRAARSPSPYAREAASHDSDGRHARSYPEQPPSPGGTP